jgi:16S rRNA (cytosine967-C5)-methyltransferase
MTPAARVSAAMEVFDVILAGQPAEKALTNWARHSRFAGSKDRAAVRDLVFQGLRCRDSYAALGGGLTGRGVMLGALRAQNLPVEDIFTDARFAPGPLTQAERDLSNDPKSLEGAFDVPGTLLELLKNDLSDQFPTFITAQRTRAPMFLRVNLNRGMRDDLIASLEQDGVEALAVPDVKEAVVVMSHPRRVSASQAYQTGLCEIQDLSSQRVVHLLPLQPGMRILDYCAGGGGKALAIAAASRPGALEIVAHDRNHERMRDIPVRAKRAGVHIPTARTEELGQMAPFDLVIVDAPCSGSGTWRRTPDAKWRCTAEKIHQLCALQSDILRAASKHLDASGHLVYVTCSVFVQENEAQVAKFLEQSEHYKPVSEMRVNLTQDGGDGFYGAVLRRAS